MFTGIVEETGRVASLEARPAGGARVRIRCGVVLEDAREGSSIAVNGVCLTALDVTPEAFSADLAPETLRRTNLGGLNAGALVNLERPLLPTSRIGGHIVQGHVDGTGEVVSLEAADENWWLDIRVPADLDRYLVFKGSVAVDGMSLTVASLEGGHLGIAIIPHTYRATRVRDYRPDGIVNIECDILAKHIEKFVALGTQARV